MACGRSWAEGGARSAVTVTGSLPETRIDPVQRGWLPFLRVKVPPTEESSAVVVISSDGKGDRPVGSLDVKDPGGWGDPVRSGAARLAPILAGESPANRGVQCCCSHIQRREGQPDRPQH